MGEPRRRLSPREPPGRAPTAGKPWPRLGPQPAVPTRCHAADPAPTSSGNSELSPEGPPACPTPAAPCSLALPVGSRRSPMLPSSSQSSTTPGKISLSQESARLALLPRRQAGACIWGRRHAERDTRRHPDARRPRDRGSIPGRVPGGGGPGPVRREGCLLRPWVSRCAGSCAGWISRATLSKAVWGHCSAQLPCALGRAISSPLASLLCHFPSLRKLFISKNCLLRLQPPPLLPFIRRCLAEAGVGELCEGVLMWVVSVSCTEGKEMRVWRPWSYGAAPGRGLIQPSFWGRAGWGLTGSEVPAGREGANLALRQGISGEAGGPGT